MDTETYCIAGRLRMQARILTSRYNGAFLPLGVTFTQAGLLMHLFAQPGIRQAALAKKLQIEKSAMNRDVKLLQKNGWLTNDLRHGLFLTDHGTSLAKRCHNIWKSLNQQVYNELGPDIVGGLTALSQKLIF
ncbi:MarR family transcriptional regulator [Spirosoma sp. SC4-14]|uniref:MarR family winged helix-turn-helix transcriptional regulator n=1 Tax=Spirosoma sp. SC4-14 TaxID=3128900 RepID=UPI0030D53FF5